MSSNILYWQKKHTKYADQDWITKPTIFATQMVGYFPKKGHILELGAGQGQDTIFFAKKGYKVSSCDFSNFALIFAKKRLPPEVKKNIEFKLLDLSNPLPFKDGGFDVVYSHLALHYFDETRTQKLFNEIYDILKDGGIFATITNTLEDPEISDLKRIDQDYYVNADGLKKRYFSVDSMKKFTNKFKTILLDANGQGHKEPIKTLIRFVGKK
jgi:SAM-dependent methyltransferase